MTDIDIDEARVRAILKRYSQSQLLPARKLREISRPILEMGEKVFPVFEAILDDPKSDPSHARAALQLLIGMEDTDRKRFVDRAVKCLARDEEMVRLKALHLLGRIGSAADTAPLYALFADKLLQREAVRTIVEIGGKRDLATLSVWLRANKGGTDEEQRFRSYVEDGRDDLEERLTGNRPAPRIK
ncbi:HEAT repeat domain-containing protein [Gemmata sp.]|uniref:HEAT repeat domain-containing protein n=1 Tax=Gemmata sp. TaxID=1914242 RepID=UPI003F6EB0F3